MNKLTAIGGAGASEYYPSQNLVKPSGVKEAANKNVTSLPYGGFKLPAFKKTSNISRSSVRFTTGEIGNLFFRDAAKVIPMLQADKNFVVYFISSHSSQLAETFTPPILEPSINIPYCVIQTGAKDATGCAFTRGGIDLMKNLFSINLLYSFQYLLGLVGDNVPRVFSDLYYSTNDTQTVVEDEKETIYYLEEIPNKTLYFKVSETEKGFGVHMFDPNAAQMWPFTGSLFKKITSLDSLFTSVGGTTISALLPHIIQDSPVKNRPAIFVFYGCSSFSTTENAASILTKMSEPTFYQFNPGSLQHIFKPVGSLPNHALPNSQHKNITELWRNTYNPNIFNRTRIGVHAANEYIGPGVLTNERTILNYKTRVNRTRKGVLAPKNMTRKAAGPVRTTRQMKTWKINKLQTMSGRLRPLSTNNTRKNNTRKNNTVDDDDDDG